MRILEGDRLSNTIKKYVPVLFLFVLMAYGVLGISIENADVRLTSKQVFYCEPVFRGEQCLVKAWFEVDSLTDLGLQQIKIDYKDDGQKAYASKDTTYSLVEGSTQVANNAVQQTLSKGLSQRVYFEFWTAKSGKFDVVLGKAASPILVLDPFYNVTINSSSPSYYLVNGTSNNVSDSQYSQKLEISSGLSDSSDATKYELRNALFGSQFVPNTVGAYRFEEGSGTTIVDSSPFGNNGKNYGATYSSPKGSNATGSYSLYFNSSARVNVSSNSHNSFTYPKSFTIGCWFNATKASAATRGIISKGFVTASNSNWNIYLDGALNKTFFQIGNGTTNYAIGTSTNTAPQGRWTHIVVTANNTAMCIYLNGVMKTCSVVTVKWKATNGSLLIGRQSKTSNPFLGKIDECSILNYSVSRTGIKSWYDGGILTSYAVPGKALKPYFNYSANYSQKHFLVVKKVTPGLQSVKVYPYLNSTDINKTLFKSDTLHQGYDSIEVTGILSQSRPVAFRLVADNGFANISELSLLEERFDSSPPQISDCSMNSSAAGCGDTVLFQCKVTDNVELKQVFFGTTANGYNYSMVDRTSPGSDYFYKKISFPSYNGSYGYSFGLVNATDFILNSASVAPGLSGTFSCCVPSWESYYVEVSSCLTNDSYYAQKLYNDTSGCGENSVPGDNGTIMDYGCDYCTPDFHQRTGEGYDCNESNTQYIYYDDWNYCCAITGLPSDCAMPLDHNTTEVCYYDQLVGTGGLNIKCDSEPVLKKKMYCYATINLTNSSGFKCLSYVRQHDKVMQTSPLYVESESLLDVLKSDAWGFKTDTREFFQDYNGIVNFYFTNKNVVAYTGYILGLICNSGTERLQSEMHITPLYEGSATIVARSVWLKDEFIIYFVIGFMVMIVVGIIVFWRRR